MHDVAEQVSDWLAEGRDVRVAQVVATRGFSSRIPGEATVWVRGERDVPAQLLSDGLVELTLSDGEAAEAGLSCGGTQTLLVQPAAAFPDGFWRRLAAREPVCVVTTVAGGVVSGAQLFTRATIRDAYAYADAVPRLFGRGVTATQVFEGDPTTVAVALWPATALLVVGDGLIADALGVTAASLGWEFQVRGDVDEAVAAVATLHRSDALLVLSHDRNVDGPVLAAALGGSVGYVGALGSRRTQEARREWLTGHGVGAEDQARIHGPAGLDIDAHTPAEIAISVAAEIIGHRSGSAGTSLRDREGPVHVTGVHAPPPRYPS